MDQGEYSLLQSFGAMLYQRKQKVCNDQEKKNALLVHEGPSYTIC